MVEVLAWSQAFGQIAKMRVSLREVSPPPPSLSSVSSFTLKTIAQHVSHHRNRYSWSASFVVDALTKSRCMNSSVPTVWCNSFLCHGPLLLTYSPGCQSLILMFHYPPQIPDEIVSLILVPLLHVPESEWRYRSVSAPFSWQLSSSVLIAVCKQWCQVASPLLYHTIGASCSFALVLGELTSSSPALATSSRRSSQSPPARPQLPSPWLRQTAAHGRCLRGCYGSGEPLSQSRAAFSQHGLQIDRQSV